MNKKILIPLLIFIICWNTVLISFNDAVMNEGDITVLAKSESTGESEEIEELITVYNHTSDVNQTMTWDDYIFCVVSAEMPVSYGIEALKAQAVAARTYTLYCINNRREVENGADICTDYKHCQAFKPANEIKNELTPEQYELLRRAVEETKGEVLVYNGEIINAVYHASSYGKTESAQNVWGTHVQYLVSVSSEDDENSKGFESKFEIAKNNFLEKIKLYGYATNIRNECEIVVHYNENNRASSVELIDVENGRSVIPATDIRRIFGLKSCSFTVSDYDGKLTFNVKGYGHGVGMSQCGAKSMAERGLNYKEILLHYYNGCEIEKRNF